MLSAIERQLKRHLLVLAAVLIAGTLSPARAISDSDIEALVTQELRRVLPDETTGIAVAVQADGRTLFYNYGFADRTRRTPVTSEALFNLASVGKVFDALLLARAAERGEVSLDDPIAKHIPELKRGDIRKATLGQLASFTSGFSLPQDHPPWPPARYSWKQFVQRLQNWRLPPDHPPGQRYLYSHAGYLLMQAALARRFGVAYPDLLKQQVLDPLGFTATLLPRRAMDGTGALPSVLKGRAVQGYSGGGQPIGKPGDVQGYYRWPGTAQMYSCARDLARFVAAQLGELPIDPSWTRAAALSHQPVAPIRPNVMQAQAWEVHQATETIVGKNGGLNNSSSFVGLIPSRRIGLVILINRGELNTWDIGYPILLGLAR